MSYKLIQPVNIILIKRSLDEISETGGWFVKDVGGTLQLFENETKWESFRLNGVIWIITSLEIEKGCVPYNYDS